MLVLSRKQDQDIVIGDNIRVRVLKIKGNTIRLGIEAPRDVKVIRGELDIQTETSGTVTDCEEASELETEITIVFSNDASRRDAQQDVLPFQRSQRQPQFPPRQTSSQPIKPTEPGRSDAGDYASVSFRAPFPTTLQHNSLKEIINDMTRQV